MPRDPRLASLLGSPERAIEPRAVLPEFLDEVTSEQFEGLALEALAKAGVGQLLQEARQVRGLSLRDAARKMERSPSRIVAIERATTDITVATLARLAHALGYRAEIVLEPLDGQGQSLNAQIDFPKTTETPIPSAAPLWQGSVRLSTRKQHVNR